MSNKRFVFFISDRTGITVETLGTSLLSQFEGIEFEKTTIPYVDSRERVISTVAAINEASSQSFGQPVVFSTVVDPQHRDLLKDCNALLFDFFDTFILPMESALGVQSSPKVGMTHRADLDDSYNVRIEAMNFALNNDDGVNVTRYNQADVILCGVSRSGKTPACLYLALQFGIFAANYPLTEEDLAFRGLPASLAEHKKKLYGLTIDPERLSQIRTERRANSRYSSIKQCQYEVARVESLFRQQKVPFTTTTHKSIEEIATTILLESGLKRRIY